MEFFELLSTQNINLDIPTIVAMLSVGYIIKHVPMFKNLSNNLIPIFIVFLSLLIGLFRIDTLTVENVVNAFINYIVVAAVSVGIHQYGKSFFNQLKPLLEILGKSKDDNDK